MPLIQHRHNEDVPASITGKDLSITSTFTLLIAGAIGMATILALIPAAGHDQLWFLLMAQRWLHGAVLYGPQAFDSNTPAIVWLSALPVSLAEHLHLPIPTTAKLFVILLEAAIALFAGRLLPPLTLPQRLWLAFTFILLFAVVPARDLGQRDPLAALLCLPYLLATAKRPSLSKPIRLLASLLAATAFCLKPHLTLIAIATEFTLFLPSREASKTVQSTARPASGRTALEPLLILTAGALFLLAIHRFTPLFFTLSLPTVLSTYWAIGHLTAFQLFKESLELHLLAAVNVLLYFRRREARSLTATLFLIAAMAATLSYYLQSTGWYYQQLPAITLFGCALALQLLGVDLRTPRWLPIATAALVLLALTLTWHFSGYSFTHLPTEDETYAITTPDPSFFQNLSRNAPIATLTTSVDDAMMPVFRYHLTWAQRTNNLWTLPAILRTQTAAKPHLTPQRLAQLEAQQRQWMIEDLTHWTPALILVARCQDPAVSCQTLEDRHDNILAFYLQDPTFAALWTHYHFQRSSGPYDAYSLKPGSQFTVVSSQ